MGQSAGSAGSSSETGLEKTLFFYLNGLTHFIVNRTILML